MKDTLILVAFTFVFGCGPQISEVRMAYHAPNPENCALEFVQPDMNAMRPGGPIEVLGYVIVSETGIADPFSEEYRAIVRPRACAMGGEMVTIMQSATSSGVGSSGSGTSYGVLRHRTEESTTPVEF